MSKEASITAKNEEEFKELKEALDNLPERIRCDVEHVHKNIIGKNKFIFQNKYDNEITYYLPRNTRSIHYNGDEIWIVANNHQFVIREETAKKQVNFNFLKDEL